MWIYNDDLNKWVINNGDLKMSNFNYLKQELKSTRLYSRCLSGATYLPINSLENIYDILDYSKPKNWYINPSIVNGSQYSNTSIPSKFPSSIDSDSIIEYNKYVTEYGFTLKNLFTPKRLIDDSLKNYKSVDLATVDSIDIGNTKIIDGITLKEGHRVLVKDQKTRVTLLSNVDPDTYFESNYYIIKNLGSTIEYYYYDNTNGIYIFNNNQLIKSNELDNYDNCIRYSVIVKLGDVNIGKQYHLSRLLTGYYPSNILNQPIEFKEGKNWILRNRVDYNNLLDINYYNLIKHDVQTYTYKDIVYVIPERLISIGEFGVILVNQENKSNIIPNKYKSNLRSITQVDKFYWICGDNGLLIKVRKHDFDIECVELKDNLGNLIRTKLNSVTFYDDLNGTVIGDSNVIYTTRDGGLTWNSIKIDKLNGNNYSKVVYISNNRQFIGGDNGILLDLRYDLNGWSVHRRKASNIEDNIDEYELVDDINDILYIKTSNWNISYNYHTQPISTNKELLFIVTNSNNIIVYDINKSFTELKNGFIYLDFNSNDFGNIRNIINVQGTLTFYFTGTDVTTNTDNIYWFDLNTFNNLGVLNSNSNVASVNYNNFSIYSNIYVNSLHDYNATELIVNGNNSLLMSSSYTTPLVFNDIDPNFGDNLKSKLLILDYDIASKLNFFTDDGEYRMPNSITVNNIFNSGDWFELDSIIHPQTPLNTGTYSELNWISYEKDSNKVFEYCGNAPLDETTSIKPSSLFRVYNNNTIIINNTSVTNTGTLAPNINVNGVSRYDGTNTTISLPTSPTHVLYVDRYLLIVRVPLNYDVILGDVLRLKCSIVDTTLIVNKIVLGATDKYLYTYSEFNDSINNELINNTSLVIEIDNLNTYMNPTELVNKFKYHYLYKAYDIDTIMSDVIIRAKFTTNNAYYNMQTRVIDSNSNIMNMLYSNSFNRFGYSPNYNIMDYLIDINSIYDINPKFYASKEYLAMPIYRSMPLGTLVSNTVYIDYNGIPYSGGAFHRPTNKIYFGSDFEFEWNNIFINTFININISNGVNSYISERLLVMNKYIDESNNSFVLELHKGLNIPLGLNILNTGYTIDIISRRTLAEISSDLQELNNIQRPELSVNSWQDNNIFKYKSLDSDLKYKISTDSYAKILLSDSDTMQSISAILFVDNKNELSFNVCQLAKEYNLEIINSVNFGGKLYISCADKHDLKTGDGVILQYVGGVGSSQEINPHYSGYHIITKINDTDFLTDINYGILPSVVDTAYVKYVKYDPFLNYQPIDLIEVSDDVSSKMSIELSENNLILSDTRYMLRNIDLDKFRFRLVDGLTLEDINNSFSWILEAEISNAIIGIKDNELVWYKGVWIFGRWFGGIWESGTWLSGDWYGGTWNSNKITDNRVYIDVDYKTNSNTESIWFGGRWYEGTWNGGTWLDGRWYDGIWNRGRWFGGTWNDGVWNNGEFNGGIWIAGTWYSGIFNCLNGESYWINGTWNGGDFENGIWYNGTLESKNMLSRFGTRAYNSRTANWLGGTWLSGEFYSGDTSLNVNKYSIWKTGTWLSGTWYGGISYNMDMKSGTWKTGIMEDIQIIGINPIDNSFTLNGEFRFNISNLVTVVDNMVTNVNSVLGSNINPVTYRIIDCLVNNGYTIIYVDKPLGVPAVVAPNPTGLYIVSKVNSLTWENGIWMNGIFDSGIWLGGMWYNGIFNGTWQ